MRPRRENGQNDPRTQPSIRLNPANPLYCKQILGLRHPEHKLLIEGLGLGKYLNREFCDESQGVFRVSGTDCCIAGSVRSWDNITLSADLLLATDEDQGDWPSNDVFRAQIEIGQLGQGWSSIYSRGSGEGGFSDYNPVTYPGLRYYDLGSFTYDLSAWKGTDDFILSFLIDGRGSEDSYLLADNIRIDAVPEPSTFLLTGLGLAVLGFCRSRRRK